MDFETAKLNETSSQLTGVQGQTTDSQSKRQNVKADTVAEVMQSPLVNGLKSDSRSKGVSFGTTSSVKVVAADDAGGTERAGVETSR